jgi:hypothetical protein
MGARCQSAAEQPPGPRRPTWESGDADDGDDDNIDDADVPGDDVLSIDEKI